MSFELNSVCEEIKTLKFKLATPTCHLRVTTDLRVEFCKDAEQASWWILRYNALCPVDYPSHALSFYTIGSSLQRLRVGD